MLGRPDQLGDQALADAATKTELLARAEDNTTTMLTAMLKELGYTTVTVTFQPPPPPPNP